MQHSTVLASLCLVLATVASAHGGGDTIRVDSVHPGSAAAAAGIQAGDELIRLDGQEVVAIEKLREVLANHRPGDTVPLTVRRDGKTVELELTLRAGAHGGVALGVNLAVGGQPDDAGGEGTAACLAWIDKTYRIDSMIRDLGLDLADDYASVRSCVEDVTRGMPSERVVRYCDNFLKGHCPAMDLLTEIGEAVVRRCEERLEQSLGVRLAQYPGWRTCAQHDVFDRYSMSGEPSDASACQAAFLEKCGTNIDATIESGAASPDQRAFARCCSAERLDPERAGGSCAMIDSGFSRGPCRERPVCIDTATTEWIRCSVLE